MANQLIAHLRHVVYYLSKLKEIQKMFGENNSIAIGTVNWGYEKENINLGQKITLEQKLRIEDNENIWFDYTVAGFSFLNDIDPFQLITWIESSLNLARQMGDFEKQLTLLDYLALTYKSIGQPNQTLPRLRDKLNLVRKQGNSKLECYTLNELGDIYQTLHSGNLPYGRLRYFGFSIHFYRKALRLAREIDHKNEIAYALKELGKIYFKSGYYKHAEIYFERALLYTTSEDQKLKSDCLSKLAQTYLFNGKRALAMSYLKTALDVMPTKTGDSDIAITIFNNPLMLDTDLKEYLQILDNLLKTHEMVPAHKIRLLLRQASLYQLMGNDKKALSVLQNARIAIRSMNDLLKEFDVLIFEARIHLFNGDKVTAAQKFQEAIELLEKNGYSRSLATKTRIDIFVKWPAPLFRLFNYFGRFLFKARKITFFILRLRSNYLEWRYRANNVEEADLDMTFEELRTVVRKNPKNIKKLLELAGAHKQIREFDLASREVNEIISISPNNPEAYNIKAGVLDSLKDYAGALECYSKAIFLKPNNSSYFVSRGLLLFHLSNLEEALSDFSTAIRIRPKQALYYAHRGMALSRLGRKSDSEKDFEKAFKLKAGAYAYVDKAMIAALDLDVGNTVSNLKLAYDLNPAGTLDIVKFDPCFEKIKTLPAFREFMVEIDD